MSLECFHLCIFSIVWKHQAVWLAATYWLIIKNNWLLIRNKLWCHHIIKHDSSGYLFYNQHFEESFFDNLFANQFEQDFLHSTTILFFVLRFLWVSLPNIPLINIFHFSLLSSKNFLLIYVSKTEPDCSNSIFFKILTLSSGICVQMFFNKHFIIKY